MDEFQAVKRKGRKKKILRPEFPPEQCDESTDLKIDVVKQTLIEARDFIQATEFFKDVQDELEKVFKECQCEEDHMTDVVSYGIGNFADCVIARYQLALLMALRQTLQVPMNQVMAYDPKFWQIEKDVMKDLNFEVINTNEEGKRTCESQCLFYMPHCGKALYNNLLWANWKQENLSRLIIIGNSFNNIVQNTPSRLLQLSGKYIVKINPYVREIPLPNNFQYSDVFNDTVILWFPVDVLKDVPAEFWEDCSEPEYDPDDLEIIPNK